MGEKMKSLMVFPALTLTIMGLLLACASAKADDLAFTIFPQIQSVSPGDATPLLFYATVTDTDALDSAPLNLNGDQINIVNGANSLPGDDLVDDTGFWLNFWGPIDPQQTISDQLLLAVTVSDPTTPYGLYAGTFEIVDPDNAELGTASFEVDVSPEPSSFLLLATGLAGLAGTLRRRAKRSLGAESSDNSLKNGLQTARRPVIRAIR
jgi:hypothetical protein